MTIRVVLTAVDGRKGANEASYVTEVLWGDKPRFTVYREQLDHAAAMERARQLADAFQAPFKGCAPGKNWDHADWEPPAGFGRNA